MPESSVDSYINAQPEVVLSKDQFWQQNYAGKADGVIKNPKHYNDWEYWVAKNILHTNAVSRFESEYENYLNNLNNRNEFLSQQSARGWDKYLDDTKYQRMMKDFEAAGLNPYLLINDGGISASSAPSSSKADYKAKSSKDEKNTNGRDIALLFLALSRIAAALL